jgi:hypothetical protein
LLKFNALLESLNQLLNMALPKQRGRGAAVAL